MNSIYSTSVPLNKNKINTSQVNESCIKISESYKDVLFNHILGIHNASINQKENLNILNKNSKNQGIKDAKCQQRDILSTISPNLGSLSQFFNHKIQNRPIFTNKRKRQQQSHQQNTLKRRIAQRNVQQAVLLSDGTSNYEKKLASRVIVQKIFQNIYKIPLQQFSNPCIKKENIKNQKLNISTLQNLLHSPENKQMFLQKTIRKAAISETDHLDRYFQDKKQIKVVYISFDKETKLKGLIELKSKYHDLKHIQIPKNNSDFALMIQAQNQLDKQLKIACQRISFTKRNSTMVNSARNSLLTKSLIITEPVDVQKRMRQVSEKFRKSKLKSVIYSDTIAKVAEQQVIFKKMQFKDLQMGLFMIDYIKLQKIKVIRLENITIQMSLLFLFMDALCRFAPKINPLKQFSMCSISVENLSRFSEKISEVLEQINIKKLCLNYTDIGNRQFTKICMGISKNDCLQEIQMRNNRLDYLSIKPLEQIMKMRQSIKSIDLRNNEIANAFNFKSDDSRIII